MKELKLLYNGTVVLIKIQYCGTKTVVKVKIRTNTKDLKEIKISSLKNNGIDILLRPNKCKNISNYSFSFIIDLKEIEDDKNNYKVNIKGNGNLKGRIILSKDLYKKED